MTLTETQARTNLQTLIADFNRLTDDERRTISEASVVRQFIDRLLEEVLGWPIKDPQRYKYELHTQVGRPDLTLFPENGGVIFIEAKKFGVIKELAQSRTTITGVVTPGQLALPGMAVDRTPEEQQAINYAFANGGTWAILTNFEKLRLFNARRDWLVLSFEKPIAYVDEFDLLWQLAYPNVLKGSLETLSSQRHREDVDGDYLSFINDWREKLARDVLARPALNRWAFDAEGRVRLNTLRAVVQRFLDRLVIIRFAEDHLVLKPGTLRGMVDLAKENPYTFSVDEFVDRFFRQFDKSHNSALFAPDVTDEASFSDDALMPLVEKLYEARYRAMPADILGNTYEQYLGKTLVLANGSVTSGDNLETRKKQGSYYTPQVIVRYIVDHSLGRWLYATENGRSDGTPLPGAQRKTSADLRDLRVLDAACGSGSFLIYAYYLLAEFYEGEIARLNAEAARRTGELARAGMTSLDIRIELAPLMAELQRLQEYPRLILETHLYGVDLDPQAAEIAVVNLMMRAMERRGGDKRLPLILNQNVKVGNALVGLRPDDPRLKEHAPALAALHRLRADLLRAPHGDGHDRIVAELQSVTAGLTAALDAPLAAHFDGDLTRVRPFHWGAEFPEVFFNADGTPRDTPGFTIVVGNPPWEILKPDLREFYAQFDARIESAFTRARAEQRIAELDAENPARRALYDAQTRVTEQTAAYVRQSSDYTRQGRGDTATHKLFLERAYTLLANDGRLGYLVPSGIYTDLGTKDLREMLLNEGSIEYIFSFSNERFFFPGVDHRFKFALVGAHKGGASDGFWAAFRFNPRVAVRPDDLPAFLADERNLLYVRRAMLEKFSPDSLSVMEFQSTRDYEVAEKIYGSHPLLGEQRAGAWHVRLNNEFHFTNDRHLFNQAGDGYPLYEGKMIHQFDAFYAAPQFWIAPDKIATLSPEQRGQLKTYRVAHRRIARSTDERTLIAAVVPPDSACEINATVALIEGDAPEAVKLYVCALFNALVLDYVLRQKVSTTLNMFYIESLPLPRLTPGDPIFDAIVTRAARLVCTRAEFAALWRDVTGTDWTPEAGALDAAERARLRDELDALVARLYGLSRADFAHVLSAFPLVFPDTNAGREKQAALLSTYDRFAAP